MTTATQQLPAAPPAEFTERERRLIALLESSLKYLDHPKVQEVSENFVVPSKKLVERIERVFAEIGVSA
jgi:hypothetical protein